MKTEEKNFLAAPGEVVYLKSMQLDSQQLLRIDDSQNRQWVFHGIDRSLKWNALLNALIFSWPLLEISAHPSWAGYRLLFQKEGYTEEIRLLTQDPDLLLVEKLQFAQGRSA